MKRVMIILAVFLCCMAIIPLTRAESELEEYTQAKGVPEEYTQEEIKETTQTDGNGNADRYAALHEEIILMKEEQDKAIMFVGGFIFGAIIALAVIMEVRKW